MTSVQHVIVGPDEHGVVRHARQVASWCGHPALRAAVPYDVVVAPGTDVVHVAFTDRLFGATLAAAQVGFDHVCERVHAAGASLSVTLHDLPHDDSAYQRQRRALYQHVVARARGVVVNSRVELALVEQNLLHDGSRHVHSLRVIPLPIEPLPTIVGTVVDDPADRAFPRRSVAVLGFVYPDRGYDDVLTALPDDAVLIALGRPADGHEDLADRLARDGGERWRLTGYVPDDRLARLLARAAVPVAPNRRVTASGSINTWIAHGRRPLVPDGPYAREVRAARPGCVTLYDADDPRALASAIRGAFDDPRSTWLPAALRPGSDATRVAAGYTRHLEACVPPRARCVGGGRVAVPGNRWDLVTGGEPVAVSVVVPYFEDQPGLDRLLTALTRQDHPAHLLEVVVADDGSRFAPDVCAAGPLPVRVVRQADHGFRAAAARNLGASAAQGDVLVFLDQDMVPEPTFVSALTRLPARCPDVITVGRRRHADLSSIGPDLRSVGWRFDLGQVEQAEPSWLRDAYRRSRDLLDDDRRAYRYVISAVLAMSRDLFEAVDGFDERFVGYGGEDWELAHRLRVAGAVFAHVADAVAWHDGPDWAARYDEATRDGQKRTERARLADLLPDPDARPRVVTRRHPSVLVHAGRMSAADALRTVRTIDAGEVTVFLAGMNGIDGPGAEQVIATPGVVVGTPSRGQLARAWAHAWVDGPADLTDLVGLAERAELHGTVRCGSVRVRSARAMSRAHRWAGAGEDVEVLAETLFGHRDVIGPR